MERLQLDFKALSLQKYLNSLEFPVSPVFFTIAKKYPQPSAEETANLTNLHNCQKFQSVFAFILTYLLVANGENNSRLISRCRQPRKLEMEFFCGSAITNAAAARSDRFVCITHSLRRVIFGQPVPQSRRGSRCGGRGGGGGLGIINHLVGAFG